MCTYSSGCLEVGSGPSAPSDDGEMSEYGRHGRRMGVPSAGSEMSPNDLDQSRDNRETQSNGHYPLQLTYMNLYEFCTCRGIEQSFLISEIP